MMDGGPSMRDRLVSLLKEGNQDFDHELGDDTSLIRSGLLDSLGLFNLALWIEKETRSRLDLASLDPSKEWETIPDILNFIEEHREG
ncbi:MAG: acyl carrier protein [Syntrophobacterales bacterium]|nr:MAG: acyl carrier protein [Syntrophobacterales bacterium]